jgi:hypothetical protein
MEKEADLRMARRTWHQLLRNGITVLGNTLASFLRLPKGSLFTRYFKILVAFAISGVIHLYADTLTGVAILESGAMHFFVGQGVLVIFEDAVQELARRTGLANTMSRLKWLGYIWVCFELFCMTPRWSYPQLRQGMKMELIPWRLVERISKLMSKDDV